MKEGESDTFAYTLRPVWHTGFLLHKYGKQVFHCTNIAVYLGNIFCSWIVI